MRWQQLQADGAIRGDGSKAGLQDENGTVEPRVLAEDAEVRFRLATPLGGVRVNDDFPDQVIVAAHERLAHEPVEAHRVVTGDAVPLIDRNGVERCTRTEY